MTCNCLMCIAEGENSPHRRREKDQTIGPKMNTSVLVKRPVAFRIPRVVDDKMSDTEWRYFTDEETAYKESEALGVDYQALFVRDGTAIVMDRSEIEAATVEACAKVLDVMAEEQDATNKKYPDHAKAYATWVDRVIHFRWAADNIRKLALPYLKGSRA